MFDNSAAPTPTANPCWTPESFHSIETATLRHLANAVDATELAYRATDLGPVSDRCEAALRELRDAIKAACGEEI